MDLFAANIISHLTFLLYYLNLPISYNSYLLPVTITGIISKLCISQIIHGFTLYPLASLGMTPRVFNPLTALTIYIIH